MPSPVPALPDTERRTRYSITSQAGPFDVGFAIYGDGTDYINWVEVWLDGEQLTANVHWTLSLASGTLATAARPLTNARVTLTGERTGTLDIVGARRPRRTSQFTEGQPIPARSVNQVVTDLVAMERERWDGQDRAVRVPPGDGAPLLAPRAARANTYLGFDGGGDLAYIPRSPAVLPPVDGYLALSQFDGLYEDVYRDVQAAFDAAAESGRLLIGDGGVRLMDGQVVWQSNTHYRGEGATFRRYWGDWNIPLFKTEGWDEGDYIDDVALENLWIDDGADDSRFGMFILAKINKLRMIRQRLKKLGANWTQFYGGNDLLFVEPWVDCYDATKNAALPDEYQVWCDAMHFNVVNDVRILAPKIRSQDDCIAFTYQTSTWTDMLPDPAAQSRNIVVNGGILQSRYGRWINIGDDDVGDAVAAGAAYKNVLIGGFIGVVDDLRETGTQGGITVNGKRTAPTDKHTNIKFHDIEVLGGSPEEFELFLITGQAEPGAARNIGSLEISNVTGTGLSRGSGYIGTITGVDSLVLDNVRITADSGARTSGNGLAIEGCSVVTMRDSDIRANAVGNALSFSHYDFLTLSASYLGGADSSSPDEYAAISLTPNTGAILKIDGVVALNAARVFNNTGTHGRVIDGSLELFGITYPATIPDEIALATGRWVAYDPGAVGASVDGPPTSAAATGRWRKIGPTTARAQIIITYTTNGSAAGAARVNLPVAVDPGYAAVSGRENGVLGGGLTGFAYPTTTELQITYADAAYPGADGATLIVECEFEIAEAA